MTAFLYLLSYATHRVMKVVRILGTMLLNRTQPDGSLAEGTTVKIVGTLAHYAVGIFFALVYLALWDAGLGLMTASWGLFFGCINGVVGMAVWYFFFLIHPRPPLLQLWSYLHTLVFAHIIFGFVATYTFYLLLQPEYSFWR